jgi:Tripartite tricarboxylate transporter TctB family
MRIRAQKDFWAGVFFLAVAAGFIGMALQYHMGTMHKMGPALFPILIGTLLGMLGLLIAGRALIIEGPPVPQLYARPIGISLVAIALFGAALAHLGLLAAVAVLVIVSAFASRETKPLETTGLVLVLMLFSAAVFVWLLGLPIPLWPES